MSLTDKKDYWFRSLVWGKLEIVFYWVLVFFSRTATLIYTYAV